MMLVPADWACTGWQRLPADSAIRLMVQSSWTGKRHQTLPQGPGPVWDGKWENVFRSPRFKGSHHSCSLIHWSLLELSQ